MPIEFSGVISTRRLPNGAKVIHFTDGKYKFIPSPRYMEIRNKLKSFRSKRTIPNCKNNNCNRLINDILAVDMLRDHFKVTKKNE